MGVGAMNGAQRGSFCTRARVLWTAGIALRAGASEFQRLSKNTKRQSGDPPQRIVFFVAALFTVGEQGWDIEQGHLGATGEPADHVPPGSLHSSEHFVTRPRKPEWTANLIYHSTFPQRIRFKRPKPSRLAQLRTSP